MAQKELNLRNTNTKSEWSACKPLSSSELDAITENNTDSSASLNALPTPFARFHIFKEAFRRVKKEGFQAGGAYTRLVSHCLDLLELLFHQDYHQQVGEEIEIIDWEKESELKDLKIKSPVLAHSISMYLADPDFVQIDRFYFIVLKKNDSKTLLGCSSPYSLLATKPDLDTTSLDLKKKDGKRSYFGTTVLLENRDKEFQQYLFNIFNGQNNTKLASMQEYVLDCLKGFSKVEDIQAENIRSNANTPLVIEGISLQKWRKSVQPFLDHLIQVPFKIRNNFYTGCFQGKVPTHDYLLPLSAAALSQFKFDSNFKMKFTEKNGGVEVELFIDGVSIHKHKYEDEKIVSIKDNNLYLSIFPLVRATKFNNNFSVYAAVQQNGTAYPIDNPIEIELFEYVNNGYKKVEEFVTGKEIRGIRRSVRTKPRRENKNLSSVVYESFGTQVDLIRIQLTLNDQSIKGVIIPKFDDVSFKNEERIYAIDLGTTNTFVCCSGKEKTVMTPLSTNMLSIPLHTSIENRNLPEICCIEGEESDTLSLFRSEYMPAKIGNELYKFPIRTALNCSKDSTTLNKMMGDGNIAFCFEKNLLIGDNTVITNIKWNENKDSVRLFIRQLLYVIRTDMITDQINPQKTTLVWFKPLSFDTEQDRDFANLWEKEAKEILFIEKSNIKQFSESETPYYYYSEKDLVGKSGSSVVMDIGGGTTDIVVYNDSKPFLATSLKFGCNVLWNNLGNTEIDNRENGIYKKLIANAVFPEKSPELELLEQFKSAKEITTADIVNLLIAHNDKTKAVAYLEKHFKLLYLFHYVSLLYHTAQIAKTNGLPPPRTLVFSGNGSKYLDYLTHKSDILAKIANFVFGRIYESQEINTNIVLPDKERKEATCYGGIRKVQTNKENETVEHRTYLGVSHEVECNELKTFKEISEKKEVISQKISQNIEQLLSCYSDLFRELNLITELSIKTPLSDSMKEHLQKKVKEAVDDMFVGLEISGDKKLNESLFFPPISKLLSELTDLVTKDQD